MSNNLSWPSYRTYSKPPLTFRGRSPAEGTAWKIFQLKATGLGPLFSTLDPYYERDTWYTAARRRVTTRRKNYTPSWYNSGFHCFFTEGEAKLYLKARLSDPERFPIVPIKYRGVVATGIENDI